MKKSMFQMESLLKDSNSLSFHIEQLLNLEDENSLLFDIAEEALYQSSKINIKLREILSENQIFPYSYLLKKTAVYQNIKIQMQGNYVYIQMPPLLPHKGSHYQYSNRNHRFYSETMDYVCSRFYPKFLQQMGGAYEKGSILICQRYVEQAISPDFDNLDISALLNVWKRYFLIDDNGKYCHLHFISKQAKQAQPATEIYIVAQTDFLNLYHKILGGCE